MHRTKAFVLVELIAGTLAISALSLSMLLLALSRVRVLAKRAKCAGSCKAISSACAMYAEDPAQEGNWVWINGTDWNSPTGTNFEKAPPKPKEAPDKRAVTSLMFLLVRQRGVSAAHFVCPNDANAAEQKDADPEKHWDFKDARHVSYSYAAPLAVDGGRWANGCNCSVKEPSFIGVLADKTPATDGRAYPVRWGPDISDEDRRKGMSPNHGGEAINIVYLDYHVGTDRRADIGVGMDCIYTAAGEAGPSRTSQSVKLADHKSGEDTFLIGPNGKRR